MDSKEVVDIKFEAIKAMFETGSITNMRQLNKLSPTKISKALGLNYGRYIKKLHNPGLFSYDEIRNLANILNTKFSIINTVVIKEIELTPIAKSKITRKKTARSSTKNNKK